MELSSYIYVVRCADNSFYTGYTTDLVRRIRTHNAKKGAKYTRARVPVSLVYYEQFETKSEATKAEYAFKKFTREQKEQYIAENIKDKEDEIIELNKKIKKEK